MADEKLLVVVNEHGSVIATARPGQGQHPEVEVGLAALPGQTIHEITVVGEELEGKSARELHDHLAQNHLK